MSIRPFAPAAFRAAPALVLAALLMPAAGHADGPRGDGPPATEAAVVVSPEPAAAVGPAAAVSGPGTSAPAAAAGPTLARIAQRHEAVIGFRDAAFPFSTALPSGEAAGYSIDLCRAIVERIRVRLGLATLPVRYVPIDATGRIAAVREHRIDLECGSTSVTAERREVLGFSPVIYVTGVRLLVPKGSDIRSAHDLNGRRIAFAAGTTNETVARDLDRRFGIRTVPVSAPTLRGALNALLEQRAEAVVADEALQQGRLAQGGPDDAWHIVGDPLSSEHYAIAFAPDDPELATLVQRTLRELVQSRAMSWIYEHWFTRRTPLGPAPGVPMSAELRARFEQLAHPQ